MKAVSIEVDGRKIGLEKFLLELPGRPVPKAPTHYVVAEVVNVDLSIKRVTVYFNEEDYWVNPEQRFEQNSKSIGSLIGGHLSFLSHDRATMAYKYWVVSVASNEVVHQSSFVYRCKKYEH